MIYNQFEDTNVMFSKTQILSDASDCSNDIEFPPSATLFLIFLFSFYSKTTATIFDIPTTAEVNTSPTKTEEKAKNISL